MNQFVDLYCERRGTGFWAEPFNAVTNIVFVIAALAAWQSAQSRHTLTREIWLLIGLSATVGLGSFLFHTFATVWAKYLDMIPILLFQMAFIWIYARGQMGSTPGFSGFLLAGLLLSSLPLMPYQHLLNGSLSYLPAWCLLVGFAAYHIRQNKNQPWQLLIASILLFAALFFRTIDLAVCGTIPIGTHFLWHLINGVVFYLVMQSVIVNSGNPSESF